MGRENVWLKISRGLWRNGDSWETEQFYCFSIYILISYIKFEFGVAGGPGGLQVGVVTLRIYLCVLCVLRGEN